MLFILCLLTIPVFYAYFFMDWDHNRSLRNTAPKNVGSERQKNAMVMNGRIVLNKDKSVTINRIRLVFKGLKDKTIHIDVCLLEFDPETSYPHFFSKADARKGFCVGDLKFQLLRVSTKILQLKIIDVYNS